MLKKLIFVLLISTTTLLIISRFNQKPTPKNNLGNTLTDQPTQTPIQNSQSGENSNTNNQNQEKSPNNKINYLPPKNILDDIKKLEPLNIDYSDWNTYTNTTHKYSLRYPKDWVVDYTIADNVEYHQDTYCCNMSKLTIKKGQTQWELLIDVLYTGGQGWGPENFEECSNKSQNACEVNYKGPIEILGLKLYKKTIFVRDTSKILFVNFGEINDTYTDVKPVFQLPSAVNSNNIRFASISYTGSNIEDNIKILDGITLSLKKVESR